MRELPVVTSAHQEGNTPVVDVETILLTSLISVLVNADADVVEVVVEEAAEEVETHHHHRVDLVHQELQLCHNRQMGHQTKLMLSDSVGTKMEAGEELVEEQVGNTLFTSSRGPVLELVIEAGLVCTEEDVILQQPQEVYFNMVRPIVGT